MKHIYFDHSATTPVDDNVLESMIPYFSDKYGNASSIHSFGQDAIIGVDKARMQVSRFLNCKPEEVTFTSGSTESNNIAVKGYISSFRKKYPDKKIHIITAVTEHDAILEPFIEMEQSGVEVTFLPVEKNGLINLDQLKESIKDSTIFVSIMHVNSEIGTIQPIREIGKIIKKINEKKERDWKKLHNTQRDERPLKIVFHTDATQAVNFENCDVDWNYVDMLSLSAHKFYGPKGVGVLYVKNGVAVSALQTGGHHEGNRRSGTLNVPGIVGLGVAIEQITKEAKKNNSKKISKLRDKLVSKILENIPDSILNTDREVSTASHAHFTFLGVEGESVLISLDLKGVAVSTGSACASGSLKTSHVLIAIGIKKEVAHSSIRFTLGKYNTDEDIDKLLEVLPGVLERIRKINPLYKK